MDLVRKAALILGTGGGVSIMEKHIDAAYNVCDISLHRKKLSVEAHPKTIPLPRVRKLVQLALDKQSVRISKEALKMVRCFIVELTEELARKSVAVMENADRKTLMAKDLEAVVKVYY